MHRPTIEVYEAEGGHYALRRGIQRVERAEAFGASVNGLRLDLGCGPGHHLELLGQPSIAADAAHAMVAAARNAAPTVPCVQADLSHLPFDRHAFGGIWASKAHQHVCAMELPMALAEAHRVLQINGRLELTLFAGDGTEQVTDVASGDDLPGRLFTWWDPARLGVVIEAAGFRVDSLSVVDSSSPGHPVLEVIATAQRALPDYVSEGLRLLCCGLNPSWHAADAGVGYVTGSNRFWKAMAAAGLSTADRDPRHLVHRDRIGMTDLVKRPTARADELHANEYRAGVDRLDELCRWLRPEAVAVVGLAGWRAAVDRKAAAGWQERHLGPSPVYVLPSTSGLNASTSLDDLAAHLRAAVAGPPP